MQKKETLSKKEIKSLQTKKKIYEAAEQLFKELGLENVSVDSIVKKAGVAKGSFYVHFDSKNVLIAALIADYVKKIDINYQSFIQSMPASTKPSDLIILLVGEIADTIACTIGFNNMKVVYEVQITKTVNASSMLGYNRELYQIFGNLIKLGIQQGDFKTDLDIDSLAKHFIMILRGITYEWIIRYPDFNLREESQKHFELLLIGIKK
ncbi:MAG: TetR/AcrR family transcriptional regulator [Bacillota bacterium]